MDNFQIADIFSLLSKLMDIHGENSFKSKSYANAAFQLEKIAEQISNISEEKISQIKGIGDSTAKKIIEILHTGSLKSLTELIQKTPRGVIEMLNIKGLGPKKIRTIWQEMEIESLGELLYACDENRLTLYKGFGAKTQQSIKESIEFYLRHQGSFLYQQVEKTSQDLLEQFKKALLPSKFFLVGGIEMHDDIINNLEFVTDADIQKIKSLLNETNASIQEESYNYFCFKLDDITIKVNCVPLHNLMQALFEKNSSKEFLTAFIKKYSITGINNFSSETEFFSSLKISYLPPYLRHTAEVVEMLDNALPKIIEKNDIRGIIHSHSNWSDGLNTIEEMAKAAKVQGFEYLVISDHSKSAFYANGLTEERIKAQHQYIDELNQQLTPFKIFKSIECDILNDGGLDYNDNILSTFDLVIASVHSNLKMSQEKAMQRLLTAIQNPFTTILGHMTGRLLLSRNGYPIDHKTIIDACIKNNVVIELNAHPRRLDIDWRWIKYATDNGALISINPDAHSIEGFDDIYYGVIAAQKGLLTAEKNLSSFSLKEFASYIKRKM